MYLKEPKEVCNSFLSEADLGLVKHSILDVAPALDPLLVIICQVGSYRNILKLAADHLLLPHVKLFKKTKRGLELVSLSHFLHDF